MSHTLNQSINLNSLQVHEGMKKEKTPAASEFDGIKKDRMTLGSEYEGYHQSTDTFDTKTLTKNKFSESEKFNNSPSAPNSTSKQEYLIYDKSKGIQKPCFATTP